MPHKPYPVAMIPYVNMLPYRALGTPPGCCWHDYVPRDSVAALAAGKVVAAAVPVGALPGLEDRVEPLGHYGIAARESSKSVLFFSARPFDRIRIGDRMRITPDSATSVRLLYLLLSCQPSACTERQADIGDDAVGELIIGDRAMQRMHTWRQVNGGNGAFLSTAGKYPHVTDLATRWYAHCGRPFVFARWVIRRDAPPEARTILMDWLDNFKVQEEALIGRSIPLAAQRLGLSQTWIATYFQCLRRVLSDEDLEGQTLFLQEIRRRQIDRVMPSDAAGAVGASGGWIAGPGRPLSAGERVAQSMETGAAPWRPGPRQKEAS